MAKYDCRLICTSVDYTSTVEHYCAAKGTIWIGKVHASSISGCILGFRRLHLTDQTATSPALGAIRSQEKTYSHHQTFSTHFFD